MDQDRKSPKGQTEDLGQIPMNTDEKDPLNAEMLEELLREEPAEQFLESTAQEPLPPEALTLNVEEDAQDAEQLPFMLHMESKAPVRDATAETSSEQDLTAASPVYAAEESTEFAGENVFVSSTTQFDPLTDAQQLPSLFPTEPQVQPKPEPTPQTTEPVTVVPRPKRKRRGWRIAGRILLSILKWTIAVALAVAVLAAGLVGYLTVTEYSPAEREKAQSGNRQVTDTYEGNTVLRLVTFNIGYGGLGAEADFFMDGGKGVTPESEEAVLKNMSGIKRILSDIDADVMFLQEVDTDSKRSYEKNQWRQYEYEFPEYETAFALNYSCDYVPYPIGDFIGKVHSGVATFSRYNIVSATRMALPNSFSWPTRVANLKRCLLVTRHQLAGREEQLVLVNCHLEAYDDGEAKQAQTELLLSFIEEEYKKGNYVIVGGDFNQSFPDSDAYPILDKEKWTPGKLSELQRGWRYAYDDSAPTCRLLDRPYDAKHAQYYVIDGFILSPNVQLRRVETVDANFEYTDHNPVVLDITLK